MARTATEGLEYFPVDVEWDDEMEAMIAVHGNDGLSVMLNVWKGAYRRDSAEMALNTLPLKVGLAKRSNVTVEALEKILATGFELELLDQAAFEARGVLTSNGIKRRLERITADRDRMRNKRRTSSEQTPNESRTNPEQNRNESETGSEDVPLSFPIHSLNGVSVCEQPLNSVSLSLSLSKDQENGQPRRRRMSQLGREQQLKRLKLSFGSATTAEDCVAFYESQATDWIISSGKNINDFDSLVRKMIREDRPAGRNFFHPNNFKERR